ncbi:MAG TPA: polysaccharide deacetylase family protein [Thermomicrobiales bacterium]|nr:polysaccharide deacetylase family protein [Thermomicrobiales bacterium]
MTQRSTNALLGYADDARLLIVNADDFGMCHAVNEAVLQGFTRGIITSTSLMVPCAWAPDAMRILDDHPELPFSVHLTLVSEFGGYRWGPVASKDRIASLIDASGYFPVYDQIPDLLARADIGEVEIEFRAQIEAALAAGLTPSHLDWHCIADGGREDIFDLCYRLAREYGVAMRIHRSGHAERLRREGLPVVDHDVLDSYHMGFEDKANRFAALLRALPPGLTEWAVHPSLGDDESRAIEPETWQIRRADHDFVTSPEARDLIDELGIVLLDYRALQTVWNVGN